MARDDVLSTLLSTIRLSASLQFCFMPRGDWQTGAQAMLASARVDSAGAMPFHIVVDGRCWVKMDTGSIALEAGDVLAFPFDAGHQLGAGTGGRLVAPLHDLPPRPWREVPVLRYEGDGPQVRLICGYLQCQVLCFAPLRRALPAFILVRTRGANDGDWLRATIRQMVAEIDMPRAGGISMLPRLTEIILIEILRHQIMTAVPGAVGWLAALADPALSRCLSLIHDDPQREWTLDALAAASGMSRSALADRFQMFLETSPMRYVREWRLYLASVALSTTDQAIAAVAYDAGYATEAAFNRAFTRAFGKPPAAWRIAARGAS